MERRTPPYLIQHTILTQPISLHLCCNHYWLCRFFHVIYCIYRRIESNNNRNVNQISINIIILCNNTIKLHILLTKILTFLNNTSETFIFKIHIGSRFDPNNTEMSITHCNMYNIKKFIQIDINRYLTNHTSEIINKSI